MIRVIYGEDDFSIQERVREIANSIGQRDLRDTNTSIFEGSSYTKDELLSVACTVPFLTSKRLILVRGLLSNLEKQSRRRVSGSNRLPRGDWSNLADNLTALPLTTELVFIDGKLLPKGKGLNAVGPQAHREEFPKKKRDEVLRWISERFKAEHSRTGSGVASRLTELVGNDLRILDQEIKKLTLFAWKRIVEVHDVDLLVTRVGETNVFAAVDAVLERKTSLAIGLMHHLLDEGASIGYLTYMLARQVRAALMVQELIGIGMGEDEIARRTGLNPGFPLQKTLEQSRRFPYEYLSGLHQKLLKADISFKTGTAGRVSRLELKAEILVAQLSLPD